MDAPSLTPGLHRISMQDYLALPYLSSGLLNTLLAQSPYHARHEQEHREDDPNDASDTGTAIHDALLEGIDRICLVDAKDWRTNAAKEQRDRARANGLVPLLAHKVPQVEAAVKAASEFLLTSELELNLLDGTPEQTIIWSEEGVMCKARPDWLSEDHSLLLHLKTTKGNAQPEAWIRNQLIPCGYDVAAQFYERALYSLPGAGKNPPQSVFLVIEQQPPYGCSLVALAPGMADIAESKLNRALRAWAKCAASGTWTAYPRRICYAEPPPWLMNQEEEQRFLSDGAAGFELDERQLTHGMQI